MAISGFWNRGDLAPDCAEAAIRQMLAAGNGAAATVLQDAPAQLQLASAEEAARSACGNHLLVLQGRVHEMGSARLLNAAGLLERMCAESPAAVLKRLDGAFVLALWDGRRQQLLLARDPAGQRPLYYAWLREGWAFSSSLRGLRCAPGFVDEVDRGVLALFLRHGHVPAPHCIHAGSFKLAAGSSLTMRAQDVDAGAGAHVPDLDQRRYWDPRDTCEEVAPRGGASMAEAVDQLDARLQTVLAPFCGSGCGGFLSGGVDSSLLLAIVQRGSATPLPTVGVGFEEAAHDETRWMQAVARRLGTAHETMLCSADHALPLVQQVTAVWDEPFADASQLPTLLASQALAGRATLALTGDGGDELFFGHRAYRRAVAMARLSRWLPAFAADRARRRASLQGEAGRLGGWAALLDECSDRDPVHHYLMRIMRWRQPHDLLPGAQEPATLCGQSALDIGGSPEAVVQYLDFMIELGNGLMTKVESAGRACGLQTISPFLDRTLVGHAWQLPMALKVRGREQKAVLKALLCRYLPPELVYRPKRGFGPPVAAWLRGPLRGWAEALLAPARLQAAGLVDDGRVQRMWQALLDGERRWHPLLWTLLMYLAWFEAQAREGSGRAA